MNEFPGYKPIRKLGKGSFGDVYLVKSLNDGNLYVIKEIYYTHKFKKIHAEREVYFLKAFNSPYLVKYYDSKIKADSMYIIMEYCDKGNLSEYIRSNNPINESRIWDIFLQICLGIQDIHSRNIIHRDLKTMNIFLCSNGKIKIGDFGVSKSMSNDKFTETIVGTPFYISPEICQEKPYNKKTDIWSLGVVLYEMITGAMPFRGKTYKNLIFKILHSSYNPIKRNISSEFISLLDMLLCKDFRSRPTIEHLLNNKIIINKLKRDVADKVKFRPVSCIVVGKKVQPNEQKNTKELNVNRVRINPQFKKNMDIVLSRQAKLARKLKPVEENKLCDVDKKTINDRIEPLVSKSELDDILKGIENFEINFKHANDHQYSSNSSSNEKIKIPSTQRKSQNTLKNEIKHNDDNCNIIRNSLTINREEYLISLGQSEQSEDSKKAYNRVKNEIIQLIGNSTYGDIYDLFKEMSSAEDLNDGDLELFEAYVESIVDSNSVERFYELFYKVVYHENIINKL